MNKEQFLNRVRAGGNEVYHRQLEQYFKDYNGPYDEDTAGDYVRFFNNDPKALAENAQRGTAHRKSLIETGLLRNHTSL